MLLQRLGQLRYSPDRLLLRRIVLGLLYGGLLSDFNGSYYFVKFTLNLLDVIVTTNFFEFRSLLLIWICLKRPL